MHDLRARSHITNQEDLFGCQRGAVTSMILGQDSYQLTMGTLGGYVMVYDIRYSVTSSLFRHNMNYPILALATYKKPSTGNIQTPSSTLVSAGGPLHEVSQLNLETGNVEVLYRCIDQTGSKDLTKADMPLIPEYIRETNFRDNKFGTMKRESNFQQFNRAMLSVRKHDEFARVLRNT